MRVPGWAVVTGWVLAFAGLAAAEVWRGPDLPTATEVLAGIVPPCARRVLVLGVALAGALLASVLPRFVARNETGHAFGFVVSVQAAACGPYAVAMLWPSPSWIAAGAVPGLVLACVCCRYLKGTSLLPLALGGVGIALPHVAAFHAAKVARFDALPVVRMATALADVQAERLVLALDRRVGERELSLVHRWLAPPWREKAVELLVARSDEPAYQWLGALPATAFHVTDSSWSLLPLADRPLRPTLAVKVARVPGGDHGGFALTFEGSEVDFGTSVHVLTPFGSVSGSFVEPEGGEQSPQQNATKKVVFEPVARARLSEWLVAMPTGTALLVVVVPPDPADPASFVELRP